MTTPYLIWQRESNPRPFSVWGLRLAKQTEREPQASPKGMPPRSGAQNVEKNISRVGTRRTATGSSQGLVNKGFLMCRRWGDWISGRLRALHPSPAQAERRMITPKPVVLQAKADTPPLKLRPCKHQNGHPVIDNCQEIGDLLFACRLRPKPGVTFPLLQSHFLFQ